jgi:hypothetical protein
MPRKAHPDEQIAAVLRQVEAGSRVDKACRKVGSARPLTISGNGSIPGWGERVA